MSNTPRSEEVGVDTRNGMSHSQQRRTSHTEKTSATDLIDGPLGQREGQEATRHVHRKKSSGVFYYDKPRNDSVHVLKNDHPHYHQSGNNAHHANNGHGHGHNTQFHHQSQSHKSQAHPRQSGHGNYAPIQTDSESPDGSSPLRHHRRHKHSCNDSEDISSSSPSGANAAHFNDKRPPNNTPRDRKQSVGNWSVPDHILDDLCCRFIINIPEEERANHVRIFFQIELAYWFYLDFCCQDDPSLKPLGMREFSRQIFTHCPTLSDFAVNVDSILDEWREYKMAVPTYGGILLDESMNYILLAQGFWAKASWGFPKGKVNEDEAPVACAIREVYEETGFDISELVDENAFIDRSISDQFTRLYIVKGVSLDTKFHPKTRKEIRSLEWFRVDHLPTHKRDLRCKEEVGIPPNSFFMVIPFVREIRRWIRRKKNLGNSSSDDDQGILGPPPLMSGFDVRPFHQRNDSPGKTQKSHQSKTPHRRIDLGSDSGKGPSPPSQTPEHPQSNQRHPPSSGHARSQRGRDVRRGITSPSDVGRPNQKTRHPSSSICVNLFNEDGGRTEQEPTEAPSSKFPTCKAWENFQLDVNQIMASFTIAS